MLAANGVCSRIRRALNVNGVNEIRLISEF